MKTFGQHALIIGGCYFVISFLLSFASGSFFEIMELVIFLLFLLSLIVLCFKKKYKFLTQFQNKYLKTAYYAYALGVTEYFGLVFCTIPGMIYGYKAAAAEYNGTEIPQPPVNYLTYANYVYIAILLTGLIWATYKNFAPKKHD